MNLSISIPEDVASRLEKRAVASGHSLPAFVSELVVRFAASPTPIEELSGEIGRRFLESGISEDELADDLERAKHESLSERRSRMGS